MEVESEDIETQHGPGRLLRGEVQESWEGSSGVGLPGGLGLQASLQKAWLSPEKLQSQAAGAAVPVGQAQQSAGSTCVLVVDDNEDAADLLVQALELSGFDAIGAHDGTEALRQAAKVRPQVAILDIGLPVMDGFELARRLRELEGLEHIKLIALTGYGQDSDRHRTKAAGFNTHLVKPVSLEALDAAIRSLIDPDQNQI